jgi:ankyrin repeat protein
MNKRIIVAPVLAVLLTASAYAQTTDFFRLVSEGGTPDDIQAAISNGADVNAQGKDGRTPLMGAAAYNQNPEVITILLKADAGIEARDSAYGGTALMWAAANNENPEVIAALLKAGADIKAEGNGGWTPLMWAAAYNQNPEVITTLLEAGADPKAQDNKGTTALIYAATQNTNPEVIMVLLNAGADAQAKDKGGRTAFDYARYRTVLKNTDALKKLEEASK